MGEQSSSLGHYEMLWDCDHCDAKGLLGKGQRHCPNCGAPQNAEKRYFPKEGEEKRLDGHSYEGSDRHCPSCNAPMAAKAHNCSQCGAPLDGSKEVAGVAAAVAAATKTVSQRNWTKIFLIIGTIVAVIFAIWWFFIRTKSMEMTVTGHRWESSIAIDEYSPVKEEDWDDKVPSGASNRFCRQKERSKKTVETGEQECHEERRDKKDGTFEKIEKCKPVTRSESVMDNWCSYEVTKWHKVDTLKASGTGMQPAWPQTIVPATALQVNGAKKQGAQAQTFTLEFGSQSCEVKEATWKKYSDGQKAKVEVRARTGSLVCGSL